MCIVPLLLKCVCVCVCVCLHYFRSTKIALLDDLLHHRLDMKKPILRIDNEFVGHLFLLSFLLRKKEKGARGI